MKYGLMIQGASTIARTSDCEQDRESDGIDRVDGLAVGVVQVPHVQGNERRREDSTEEQFINDVRRIVRNVVDVGEWPESQGGNCRDAEETGDA